MMTIRFLYIIIGFLCLTQGRTQEKADQEIFKGVIIDKLSGSPVADAHVILANSTFSTHSDKSGKFQISVTGIQGRDIIISHISYELLDYQLPLKFLGRDTLRLKPKSQVVDVTVSTKRTNLKKQRLKIFEKTLFGDTSPSRKMSLLNPEAVLFTKKGDDLLAYATDLLQIRNEHLGYDILFLLDEYVHNEGMTKYYGKAFFKELPANKRRKKKYIKRRKETKEYSLEAFFRSVLRNDIDSSGFRCKLNGLPISQFMEEFKFMYYTVIPDVYAFLTHDTFEIAKKQNEFKIASNSGIILFNRDGQILNSSDLTVIENNSSPNLTKLLPYDFDPVSVDIDKTIFNQGKYTVGELLAKAGQLKYGDNAGALIQEIVINTDRLLYQAGETIYTSALLLNHRSEDLLKEEELVHFDLVDVDQQVIASKTKLAYRGMAETGFAIPDTIKSNEYFVRAYTDYMLNFDQGLIPHKSVGIGMAFAPQLASLVEDTMFIHLYPDGDQLMLDEPNRVAFEISHELQNGSSFEGQLIEVNSGQIIDLKVIAGGWGVFYFNPAQACLFKFKNKSDELVEIINDRFDVFTESAIELSGHNVSYFGMTFKIPKDGNNARLLVKYKGQVIQQIQNCVVGKTYKLSKEFLPEGEILLELLGAGDSLIAKRWIRNARIKELPNCEIERNYAYYFPRQKAVFEFQMDSLVSRQFSGTKWNLKVVHQEYDPDIDLAQDNVSELPANMQKFISEVSMNAYDIDERLKAAYLVNSSDLVVQRRDRLSLSGFTVDHESKERKQSKVNISSLSSDFYFDEVLTDDEGRFEFNQIPYLGNVKFILQARSVDAEDITFSDGNRDVDIMTDTISSKLDKTEIRLKSMPMLVQQDSVPVTAQDSLYQSLNMLSQQLEEVVVKSQKINTYDRYGIHNLAEINWISKYERPRGIVSKLYPSKRIKPDSENPQSYLIAIRNNTGSYTWVPLEIYINGEYQFGPQRFESLVFDQIAAIGLKYNSLIIQTNPDFASREGIRQLSIGVEEFVFEETIELDDFINFNPNQVGSGDRDERKTLAWQNDFQFDEKGSGKLSFFTSDIPGTYKLELSTIHPEYGVIRYVDSFEVELQDPE